MKNHALSYISLLLLLLVVAPGARAEWVLQPHLSSISFLSSKLFQDSLFAIFEENHFRTFKGSINSKHQLRLHIDLNSVDTKIPVRDERIKEHVFRVAEYPEAVVSLGLDKAMVEEFQVGMVRRFQTRARLNLRGQNRPVEVEVSVTRPAEDVLVVYSVAPLLFNAMEYGMAEDFALLSSIAGLLKIPTTIPISFQLFFRHTP